MPKSKEELQALYVTALGSYVSLTKAPDGADRVGRVLDSVIQDKADEFIASRFSDWELADLIALKNAISEIEIVADEKPKKPKRG